ncbi:MAG TPA: hypothetical protein VGD94_10375 [Vicinamibacterales bacterium]
MKVRILHLTLTLTMLLAFPVAAAALVPFSAVIDSEPIVVGACGPSCLELEIGGEGRATHLGRTVIEGPSQVDVLQGTQTGTSTLTAANGDTIVIAFEGTAEFSGPAATDPVTFQGTWVVIGGTGRFEGGTGSGTYAGSAAGTVGQFILEGTISRPSRTQ